MAASMLVRYGLLVVMMCSFTGVYGRTIQLNWTLEGVSDYISTPLRVELGDILELTCSNFSNLFIQSDQIQYDSCNASAGSGEFVYNGFCFSGSPIITITLSKNSQNLVNVINFMDNQIYYLTSYSDGSSRASDATFTSGGQCEDGLKMIILIGELEVPTTEPTTEAISVTSGLPVSRTSLYVIIGALLTAIMMKTMIDRIAQF